MEDCLKQFLTYGRLLTIEEQEAWSSKRTGTQSSSFGKETVPKLEDFKKQVRFL